MDASGKIEIIATEGGERQHPKREREDRSLSRLKRVEASDRIPQEVLQRAKKRAELRIWTVERELGVAESLITLGSLSNAKKIVDNARRELESLRLDAEKENREDAASPEKKKSVVAKKDNEQKIQLQYRRIGQLQRQILLAGSTNGAIGLDQSLALANARSTGKKSWAIAKESSIEPGSRKGSVQASPKPKPSPTRQLSTVQDNSAENAGLALALLNDALTHQQVSSESRPECAASQPPLDIQPTAPDPSYPASSPRWVGVDVGDLVGDEELRAMFVQKDEDEEGSTAAPDQTPAEHAVRYGSGAERAGWWSLGQTLTKVGAAVEEAISTVLTPPSSTSPASSPASLRSRGSLSHSPESTTSPKLPYPPSTAANKFAVSQRSAATVAADAAGPSASSAVATPVQRVVELGAVSARGPFAGSSRVLPLPTPPANPQPNHRASAGGDKPDALLTPTRNRTRESQDAGLSFGLPASAETPRSWTPQALLALRGSSVGGTAGERAIEAARKRGRAGMEEAAAGSWLSEVLAQNVVSMELPGGWREGRDFRRGLQDSEYVEGEMVVVEREGGGLVFGCVRQVLPGVGVEVATEAGHAAGLVAGERGARRVEANKVGKILAQGVWGGRPRGEAGGLAGRGECAQGAEGVARLEGTVEEWSREKGKEVPPAWREGREWARGISNTFADGEVVVAAVGDGRGRGGRNVLGVVKKVSPEEWTADIDAGRCGVLRGVGLLSVGRVKLVGVWEGFVGLAVLHAGARHLVVEGEDEHGEAVAIKVQRQAGKAWREGRVLEWVRGQGGGQAHVVQLRTKLLWGGGGELRHGLVLELAAGTLQRSLRVKGAEAWEWKRVEAVGSSVGRALAWLHSRGMAHTDVRPATVLLFAGVGGDVWKLGGMDRAGWEGEEEEGGSRLAGAGEGEGASVWMDPDSARDHVDGKRGAVTAERDVWGFGMLLAVLSAEDPSKMEDDVRRRAAVKGRGRRAVQAWGQVALPLEVGALKYEAVRDGVLRKTLTTRPRAGMEELMQHELWALADDSAAETSEDESQPAGQHALVHAQAAAGQGGSEGGQPRQAATGDADGAAAGGAELRAGYGEEEAPSPCHSPYEAALSPRQTVDAFQPLEAAAAATVRSAVLASPQAARARPSDVHLLAGARPGSQEAEQRSAHISLQLHELSPAAQPAEEDCERATPDTAMGGWTEVVDKASGKPYFWHTPTGKTAWEIPEENQTDTAAPVCQQLSFVERGTLEQETASGETEASDAAAASPTKEWRVGMVEEDAGCEDLPMPVFAQGRDTGWESEERAAGVGTPLTSPSSCSSSSPPEAEDARGGANPAVRELVESEKRYVERLEELVEGVVGPLRLSQDTLAPLMTEDDVEQVFSNVEEILSLNRMLCHEMALRLQQSQPSALAASPSRPLPVAVGDILRRFVPHLQLYKRYVSRLDAACKRLRRLQHSNPDLAAFLTQQCAGGQPVEALLAEPFQRVLRYRLLLSNLVKFANAGSREHAELLLALRSVEETLEDLNEAKRQREARENLRRVQRQLSKQRLTGARTRCTRQGELWAPPPAPGAPLPRRRWFLLESGLLCSERMEGGAHRDEPQVEVLRGIEAVRAQAHPPGAEDSANAASGCWLVVSGEGGAEFGACAASEKERDQWVAAVAEVVAGLKGQHVLPETSSAEHWRRRLLWVAAMLLCALLGLAAMLGAAAARECVVQHGWRACAKSSATLRVQSALNATQWTAAIGAPFLGQGQTASGQESSHSGKLTSMPTEEVRETAQDRLPHEHGNAVGRRITKVGKGVMGAGRKAVEKVSGWFGRRAEL